MSSRYWSQTEVTRPRGAWTAKQSKTAPARAAIAQNVRFFPDYVYSREGTSNVAIGSFTASAGKVGGMYNWISPSDNFLIYLDGTMLKRLKLSDGSVASLGSAGASARYPSIAELGPRVYACSADTTGTGQMLPIVHDGASATDTCFRAPIATTTFTAVDGGAGLCTLGTHRLAFLYTNRNGFTGQPNPVSGGVLAYASVTLGSGLRAITLSVAFNALSDGGGTAEITPIMTRADNLSNWFILPPSAFSGTIAVGTVNFSTTLTINISDEDLANQTSALPYFDYLVQSGVGTATPPSPDFIVPYGKRMCYVSGVTVYASEVDNPQAITADLNVVPNPSKRRVKAAWPLGQELFIGGDKWTARTRDSGDSPSTWPPPSSVSEAIGPPFPNCVEWRTAGTYVWVATEFGLFVFAGSYPQQAITYLCDDQWKRINWNAGYAIQITDDVTNRKCYVAVPLDANTELSHVFVIDYTNGLTFDTCDISIDNYGFGNFSSIRTVKEAATNRTAVWIGPQAAGAVVHVDSATHQDAGSSIIHAIWESGLSRSPGIDSSTIRVGAAHLWAHGSGTLLHTWYGLDRAKSIQPILLTAGAVAGQIPLTATPGLEYYVKGDLNPVENFTMRFEVNSLGDWFQLVGVRAYSRRSLSNR